MNHFLRILCASFTLATVHVQKCMPTTAHGINHTSRNVTHDVFISEKLSHCPPDKRAKILNKLENNLREAHASDENPEVTINATLRGFTCP